MIEMCRAWRKSQMKYGTGAFAFHRRQLSLCVFVPTISLRGKIRGAWAKTGITWMGRDWCQQWAFSILILGFGVGLAYNWANNEGNEKVKEYQERTWKEIMPRRKDQ